MSLSYVKLGNRFWHLCVKSFNDAKLFVVTALAGITRVAYKCGTSNTLMNEHYV